jgi:alpha-L-fucosidase
VRQLQPQAVMFSDAGPDVRWVGNERGVAFETSWYAIDRAGVFPGDPTYVKRAAGQPNGADWVPPEVDVSIRPGWFYHAAEDAKVKTVDHLVTIYEQSIGRGANLLLNLPPDGRGLIPEPDVERLTAFARRIDATYKTDLARQAKASADRTRKGASSAFAAARVNDGDPRTYWATDDGVTTGAITLEWPRPVTLDRVVMGEAIALGQRVAGWTVEAEAGGAWTRVAEGTTIGYKRIATFTPVTAARVRVSITSALACPTITGISAFLAPK